MTPRLTGFCGEYKSRYSAGHVQHSEPFHVCRLPVLSSRLDCLSQPCLHWSALALQQLFSSLSMRLQVIQWKSPTARRCHLQASMSHMKTCNRLTTMHVLVKTMKHSCQLPVQLPRPLVVCSTGAPQALCVPLWPASCGIDGISRTVQVTECWSGLRMHWLSVCTTSFESDNYSMHATAADDTDDADHCAAGFQQRFSHGGCSRGQSGGGAAGRVCAVTAGQASALAALARQLHCQRGMCDIHKVVAWCTVCWVAKVSLECMQLQKRMVGRRSSSRFSAQQLPLLQSWHRGKIEMQCC
jgi:hypothetical protein